MRKHSDAARTHSRKFAGAVIYGWKAYNITSDLVGGVGGWSDGELAEYLSTGHAKGNSSAAGPMTEAVDNSLRFLGKDESAPWQPT